MLPERMQQVTRLFEQALERPESERAAFVKNACGGDTELFGEVESLLAHHAAAGEGFMQPPPPMDGAGPGDADPVATLSAGGRADAGKDAPHKGPSTSNLQIDGYEITRELSRGGQGVVYQALQKTTKRKVAIKVLLEGPYASRSAQKRFEREIELVAQLRHPNIISIFHSGTTPDGRAYYVMDYVRGIPLNAYAREKKLPLEETLKLFSTVCEGVQYAHQKGVIHRDLKPSNILVDSDGVPKIMDFGLAKLLSGPVETLVSISQEVVGTLPYMSPEQARGNPDEIDTRTDVYALGVILYELLTGHYPYPVVGQLVEVLKHITQTPPTPPTKRWTKDTGVTGRSTAKRLRAGQCPIDDEVQTIVMRALSKERERRYQSAGELANDVGHYLAGDPIEAKRDSGWYLLSCTMRRHRRVLISVASVTIFVFLIAGLLLFRSRSNYNASQSREGIDGALAAIERLSQQLDRIEREGRESGKTGGLPWPGSFRQEMQSLRKQLETTKESLVSWDGRDGLTGSQPRSSDDSYSNPIWQESEFSGIDIQEILPELLPHISGQAQPTTAASLFPELTTTTKPSSPD